MGKTASCRCRSGCNNRRCACLKNNEPCDENCGCVGCQNPLNGVDIEGLSVCTIQNIEQCKSLSEDELQEEYLLPCGHQRVVLEKLLGPYECKECEGEYWWFSFCWEQVVQEGDSWHCKVCGECRDWREWHCENCNRCTYGVTLPCEHCGAEGPLADMGEEF